MDFLKIGFFPYEMFPGVLVKYSQKNSRFSRTRLSNYDGMFLLARDRLDLIRSKN